MGDAGSVQFRSVPRPLRSSEGDLRDDSAEILFQSFLQEALVSSSGMGRDVHPRKCWMDNIKQRTSLSMSELLTVASRRKDLKRISAESSTVSSRRLKRSRD